MNKQTLKTIAIAGGACIFMGGSLLTGMHLYAATLQDAVQYQMEETETEDDTENDTENDTEAILTESEKESETTGEPAATVKGEEPDYSKIPVIDLETFFHLTGFDVDEDGTPIEFVPEEEPDPRENEISIEEAALKGLKEIYRIFGDEKMEEMTLLLDLYRDKEMEDKGEQKESIWTGCLMFLDEWHRDADGEALEHNYIYKFEFSSVSGRWLSCEKSRTTLGDAEFGEPAEKLTRGERLDKAFDIIEQYDLLSLRYSSQELKEMELGEGSGVYGFYDTYLVEDYDLYREPEPTFVDKTYIVHFRNGDGEFLQVMFDQESNEFVGYYFPIFNINTFSDMVD